MIPTFPMAASWWRPVAAWRARRPRSVRSSFALFFDDPPSFGDDD